MSTTHQIIHDNRLFELKETGLFTGYVPVADIQAATPTLSFQGAPMPFSLWQQVVSFLQWSYDTYKSEALVRLYYSESARQWAAWVYPQTMKRGLSVKDEVDPTGEAEWRTGEGARGKRFELAGTVHHHCTAGAFQSGTDAQDEMNTSGLHITLGRMNDERYDLHARVSYKGMFYEAALQEWIEVPDYCHSLPDALARMVLKAVYVQKVKPEEVPFPEQWRQNCKEEPKDTMSVFTGEHFGKRHFASHGDDYQKKSRADFCNYPRLRFTGADASETDDAEKDYTEEDYTEEDDTEKDFEETEQSEKEIGDTSSMETGDLDTGDIGEILSRCVTDVQEINKLIHLIASETHHRRKQDIITYTQERIQGVSFRLLFCADYIG